MRKYGANMIRNFAIYVSRAARTVLMVFERRSFYEIAATYATKLLRQTDIQTLCLWYRTECLESLLCKLTVSRLYRRELEYT